MIYDNKLEELRRASLYVNKKEKEREQKPYESAWHCSYSVGSFYITYYI